MHQIQRLVNRIVTISSSSRRQLIVLSSPIPNLSPSLPLLKAPHFRVKSNRLASSYKMSLSSKSYPSFRRDESIVDDIHGVKVEDPYRWLEDPDAEETQHFVEAQNKVSQPFLMSCDQRDNINTKLRNLWNFPKQTCPHKHGDSYFFFKNTGLQNQSVLYKRASLDAEPTVFLDPNSFSEQGTVALSRFSFSDDGSLFAYSISECGSDWNKIKIRNVETLEEYPEVLEKVKFSNIAWTKDNKGIFYSGYPNQGGKTDGSETQINENQKCYYHRLGDTQDKDILVAEFLDEPTWRMHAVVSDCGKYFILSVCKDCRDNLLFFVDLEKVGEITDKFELTQIVHKFESDFDYITNTGSKCVLRTNKDAPNYRLIVIDFENPDPENWTTLVQEHPKDVLDSAQCVNDDKLIISYIKDVKSFVQVNNLHTGALEHEFDIGMGSIHVYGDKKYSETFFHFTSFLTPEIHYRCDMSDMKVHLLHEVKIDGFNQSDYNVEQIFYASKDGTKVPMFIIRKSGESVEPRPCLLYGYGGFNCSIQPSFSITGLVFVQQFNGVLAYPNIRGGGEYGEKWHNAGRLLNKQNVFDDFQTAGEYLVKENYTTADRLAIMGGSNGGLLVAACINQRPELFGAAIAQVGVMDMLRFHKFTVGHAWISDYGNPDEKEHFENLIKFSPLHNVRTPEAEHDQYPATLVLTADHDDRVSPLHSLKFVAALHEAVKKSDSQLNPLLLRVYSKAGHGAGKPTNMKIEEVTDILTFLYRTLNVA